jgi:hypothetical protein
MLIMAKVRSFLAGLADQLEGIQAQVCDALAVGNTTILMANVTLFGRIAALPHTLPQFARERLELAVNGHAS